MPKLELPTVTLCAAASVNVASTISALRTCLDQAEFAECLLFTDAPVGDLDPSIRLAPIKRLRSASDYSKFVLEELLDHIRTEHCLIVQWDGFVLDKSAWQAEFLSFDYIGAPWPQFPDGLDVGNGGFSLRSRKLLQACRDSRFKGDHPEDLAICRANRSLLEDQYGIRFADRTTAERFAFERTKPPGPAFGFHGIFNMIPVLGADRFWELYRSLDDRKTALVDYRLLMRQLGSGRNVLRRRARLTRDVLQLLLQSRRRVTDQAT
ncbi:MAG TPA: DUF5672 family protein [Sphingomicrobium sp.]|nr:DUF5672 family protein [Sphingomicrobium sp.]